MLWRRRHGTRSDLRLIEPVGYVEMLGLVAAAALVITDSGGLQEETTYLGVRWLTVPPNTERRITCTHGTNRLVPPGDAIVVAAERAIARRPPVRPVIERWDGRAAERIARVVCEGERYGLDDVVGPGATGSASGTRRSSARRGVATHASAVRRLPRLRAHTACQPRRVIDERRGAAQGADRTPLPASP